MKNEFPSLLEKVPGLTVHFDGKIMKDTHAPDSKDRASKIDGIAVVVTGCKIEKILGIARTDDGTGATTSEAVFKLCSEWNILEQINGMSFDTTSANTGCIKGACKIFEERYIKKNLLQFACRHHIHEIVVSGVFRKLFCDTTGPNVAIFESFKLAWKDLDQTKFEVKLTSKQCICHTEFYNYTGTAYKSFQEQICGCQ